jgi:hypothetical protein
MRSKEWRKLLKWIRRQYPIVGTVHVSRRPVKNDAGNTGIRVKRSAWTFWIHIDSKQEWAGQVDTLLHEWSHIRAIQEACDHLGRWATTYGEIYTEWTTFNND